MRTGNNHKVSESESQSFRALDDSIIIIDEQGTITEWNQGQEQISGISRDQAVGRSLGELLEILRSEEPESLLESADLEQQIRELLRTGTTPPQASFRRQIIYTLDGTRHIAETRLSGIKTTKGFMTYSITHDITEQLTTEEALRSSEQKHRSMIEHSSEGIMISDAQGILVEFNPSMERLTGISRQHALGQPVWDLLIPLIPPELRAPGFREQPREQMLAAAQSGQLPWLNKEVEIVFRRVDGSERVISQMTYTIQSQAGPLTVAMCRDITDRRQIETAEREKIHRRADELELRVAERTAELQRQSDQLQAILDNVGEGIVTAEGPLIRYVNPRLCQLTGYSQKEIMDDPSLLYTLFSYAGNITDREQLHRLWQALDVNSSIQYQTVLKHRNGKPSETLTTVTRVSPPGVRPMSIVAIVSDITSEKLFQIQKNRFINHAAHELRTPVTNLTTRLYLLRRQPEKLEQHVNVLDQVSRQMTELINELLEATELIDSAITLERQAIPLQSIASMAVAVCQSSADGRQVRLLKSWPDDPVFVLVDSRLMPQAIKRLVTNAIVSTPVGGEVVVTMDTTHDTNDVVLRVLGHGLSIPPDQLSQLFEPFFLATTGVYRGTGLSLTIAKRIVDLHGAEISVESEAGRGTAFSIRLPVIQP